LGPVRLFVRVASFFARFRAVLRVFVRTFRWGG
jgi:hypothetical protein